MHASPVEEENILYHQLFSAFLGGFTVGLYVRIEGSNEQQEVWYHL